MIKKIVANPFQAGGRLRDPKHFVGRESELRQILSRVANMDSVSVVGPRRIGKSSILHHIVASGQQRLNESYHAEYLP
jgi:ABC-type phosphate/phosphonate transport system ATPase subunit